MSTTHENPRPVGHETYNIRRAFLYILTSLFDLCLGVEKFSLKEIPVMILHVMISKEVMHFHHDQYDHSLAPLPRVRGRGSFNNIW